MFYRIKQVWWALIARPLNGPDQKLIHKLLTGRERQLFDAFSVNDKNHSIRVVKYTLDHSSTNRSLLKACLLHDVGKTKAGRLSIIDRSVAVAVKAVFPELSREWGRLDIAKAHRFQRPSIVRAQHAEWGAEMVRAAGGDDLTVSLIRRHQDKLDEIRSEEDQLLKLLQKADNLS